MVTPFLNCLKKQAKGGLNPNMTGMPVTIYHRRKIGSPSDELHAWDLHHTPLNYHVSKCMRHLGFAGHLQRNYETGPILIHLTDRIVFRVSNVV